MDYTKLEQQQREQDQRVRQVLSGTADDDAHIQMCLDLSQNDADDIVRVMAGLWLRYNIRPIAERLLNLRTPDSGLETYG
jgi:hypothetical protein